MSSPRAPSLDRLALRNRKLSALLDVAKGLMSERHIDALLDIVMEESKKTVDAERCTLFLMTRDGRELWSKIAHGLQGTRVIRMPVGQGIAGHVANLRQDLDSPRLVALADGVSRGGSLEPDVAQRLSEAVVELAGDAFAFGGGGQPLTLPV